MLVTDVLIRTISPSRQVAFSTLEAVAGGAFASDTLLQQSAGLSPRDAGLASQLVFGCLRFQSQLDYLIEHYSGRATNQLDLAVLLALRLGIYQIRYLERVPAHAAVHESVNLVFREKRSAAGLANAVLRKVNRQPVDWPDRNIELSCPSFLIERWTEHFGETEAIGIARTALTEPTPYVRFRSDEASPNPEAFRATSVPGAYQVLQPTPGLRLHDIGSQAIIPLLDLHPDHSFLDLCAAPGNKTMQALETPVRFAVACDVSLRRLQTVPPVCPRVVLDATQRLPFSSAFDRIFVDAPCSGTGTIARNPEIKWRVQSPDFRRFGEKQIRILDRALPLLATGGVLLYATCSLEREENEDVISAIVGKHPEVELTKAVWRIPGRDEGDGFYAACLRRKADIS
jgi:16S rRNA (cytosine967-C5)-methyltransferase